MKVFIDTGAFIAYFIKQDKFHDDTVRKYRLYRQQKAMLLTSDYILDELSTWFSAKQSKNILEKLVYSIYVLYKDFALDEIFTLDEDFKKMRLNTSFLDR